MPQPLAKAYFAMPKGLNSEAPLINFPDGYTTEEQNYELQVNGSRRRRPGLASEDGGVATTLGSEYQVGWPIRTFDWENVAGRPDINYLVQQTGYFLRILVDTNPVSPTTLVTLDIRPYSVTNATDAQIGSWPLQAHFGRGHIFLFGKYTNPFYVEYDPDTTNFSITQIDIMERDFVGVEDGVAITAQPTAATDAHTYNLRNRGWIDSYIGSFLADQGAYPSKAMIPWMGLKRALTAANAYDWDGVRAFSPDKLVAELFQDATAPMGHFIKSPFASISTPDSNASLPIASWSISLEASGTRTLTVTTNGLHGLLVGDSISIVNLLGTYNTDPTLPVSPTFTVDTTTTVVTTPTTSQFTCSIIANFPYPFWSWDDQFQSVGSVIGGAVPNPTGNIIDFRPKTGAFFAGRVFYAGIDTSRLTGRIFFSQVVESDAQYGKCYQVADPTDESISDIVPSDGGVISIPEASNVLKLIPYSHSLLVFASNGVWEIGAGDLGYFSANSYSIRKITDSGAISAYTCVLIDNLPVYWGLTDIYAIKQDPRQGFLYADNMSQATINTFYNSIPMANRREAAGVYDDLLKKVIWIYRQDSEVAYTYDRGLIFDARLGAFIPMTYANSPTTYLADVFVLKEAGEASKIKYAAIIDSHTLTINEPNNSTDYVDLGLSEPDCYMITGYDAGRDPGTFKEAPYITTFCRKTETGYGPAPDYEPVRTSSTQMRSRWDWADQAKATKWGRYQEIYRRRRTYIPADPSTDGYDDGAPLVVSRSALRGIGRVLQLEFRAGTGKDSWVLGWKTNFIRLERNG